MLSFHSVFYPLSSCHVFFHVLGGCSLTRYYLPEKKQKENIRLTHKS